MPLVGCTSVGDAHTYRVACGGPIAADADAVVKQVQVLYRKGQRSGRHKGRISREVVCPDCQWPQGYREFVRAWDDRHDALAASEQALAALA